MIDEIARLELGSMISIDDEVSKRFTSQEDFVVGDIQDFSIEGVSILVVELNDYWLVATDLHGETTCAICESYGEEIDYIDDNDDFAEEINIHMGEDDVFYQKGQALYSDEYDIPSFCEYFSQNNYINYLLIQEGAESITAYRGMAIEPENIIL